MVLIIFVGQFIQEREPSTPPIFRFLSTVFHGPVLNFDFIEAGLSFLKDVFKDGYSCPVVIDNGKMSGC